MTTSVIALVAAVALLVVVLVVATVRPFGTPEAVVAVPAAAIAVGTGLITLSAAWQEIQELGPTVGFLAAILLLGRLADAEGVFTWLGGRLAAASHGRAPRLLGLVFVAAAGTTAVLSLDATVVLLTPVVLATAARLRLPARPHSYACAHLSNSASGLLPVSNLTNLLAFSASGLTFLGFAGLMALPWLAVIVVEYLVLRRFFAADLVQPATDRAAPSADGDADPSGGPGASGIGPCSAESVPHSAEPARHDEPAPQPGDPRTPAGDGHTDAPADPAAPRFALVVLAVTLAGFGASSALGVEPVWIAAAGAVVLAVRALLRREVGPARLVAGLAPGFCLFVLALGVVVAAVSGRGMADLLAGLLPDEPTLVGLLAAAGIAAVLANLVNNLPATLVLLTALGPAPSSGLVLAVLLGVNIGPNLTYVGSLATLLWRRVTAARGESPTLGRFLAVGALTVPFGLLAATAALWLALRIAG